MKPGWSGVKCSCSCAGGEMGGRSQQKANQVRSHDGTGSVASCIVESQSRSSSSRSMEGIFSVRIEQAITCGNQDCWDEKRVLATTCRQLFVLAFYATERSGSSSEALHIK